MVSLVEQMLEMHKQLPEARPTRRRHCNVASRPPTGRSTAQLHGLTQEEIEIVEAAGR